MQRVRANELRRRDVGSGREPTPSDTREPESQQEAPPGDFQGGAHDAQGSHGEGNGRRLGLGKVFDVIVSLWIFCRGSLSALGTIVKRFVFATQGVLIRALSTPTFSDMYEAKYGDKHPPFFPGSFRDAFSEARVIQKPLVVYLHEEGPSADVACREALGSALFIELLALQGTWGEAEAASHAVGALDRLEELQQECAEKQEALRQTQILRREQEAAFEEIQRQESLRMSIQREERIQRERELQRRQQEARRLAQKREKRQQQLQQQKQRRTAAAADFKAQDTECNKLPPEERTTVRNNGDLQLQEQKQTQEQNKRQH
ncbi:hypothetical protein, conserved [Eimeria maxima]|uniref:Fas-associated factor 1/2-like UAS domain-containing protein n=1 Tax=Eimeria maxima TaxID=5804 RepID=U6MBG0_EIMMA|nr:hypothetical protein, conserved [Eimeria maxima]CDJ59005.1 hypothetical protein, conserved [Eimeria maxima]